MELVLCCHPVAHLSLWRIAGEFFRCPENDSRLASWMVTPATGRLEPLRGTPGGGDFGPCVSHHPSGRGGGFQTASFLEANRAHLCRRMPVQTRIGGFHCEVSLRYGRGGRGLGKKEKKDQSLQMALEVAVSAVTVTLLIQS